jgi:hypothetical protein
VIVHDPERRLIVATRKGVEIIEGPIELIELRPAEIAVSGLVVFAVGQQELAGRQKGFQSLTRMPAHRSSIANRRKGLLGRVRLTQPDAR